MTDPLPPSDQPTPDSGLSEASPSLPKKPAIPRPGGGPLNLEQIRQLRMSQGSSAQENRPKKRRTNENKGPRASSDEGDSSVEVSSAEVSNSEVTHESSAVQMPQQDNQVISNVPPGHAPVATKAKNSFQQDDEESQNEPRYASGPSAPKVPVPNARRRDASEDEELEGVLAGADLDALMIGDRKVRAGVGLETGGRHQARVIKIHNANVFVTLGGPNEGVIPLLQFTDMPTEGLNLEVVIRSFNADEGLYELSIPGEAISANDWGDLEEGAVVEARVESANTGGVECKVGNVRGFIPISQLSEFRIETAADYVGQKLLCVVTEANPRRGNLVLSHRAVLEREKQQKRQERLASLEIGQKCEGTVRKVMDFGVFVDIGGLDGLIHISQLSWDKVKHPSEVVKEGDKVTVRIEKFDPKTGKISLSYRDSQDDPWNDAEARFPTGSTTSGTVSRLANFGAFVKLATGIEGLVHISELAHRRVQNVGQVLQEGQEVEVKILSIDRNAQRISLSLKATQAKPENAKSQADSAPVEESRRESSVRKHQGPLRGGTGSGGGELFGLKF
jgi:small subunit ribosomal protein S1